MATSSTYSLPRCPVEVTLSLISSRWAVLILRELIYGTRRFGQIRKALGGVSTKVLTQNLRTMEENGLLTRETFAEVPPRVEYTLTDLGQSLRPELFSMVEWGSQYAQLTEGTCKDTLQNPVVRLQSHISCGRCQSHRKQPEKCRS